LSYSKKWLDSQPGRAILAKEGIDNAVANATQRNLREIVIPAFFFIA
jgi:hypothetical protein